MLQQTTVATVRPRYASFLERFPDRIVNVHPSLLPEFPGAHAIDDALAACVDTTGVTIHFVDEGLDTGAVIRQEPVSVEPRTTLLVQMRDPSDHPLKDVHRSPGQGTMLRGVNTDEF